MVTVCGIRSASVIRALKPVAERLSSFFHSIRFRLTLWFVFILAIVLAVFSAFIYFVQARDLQVDEVSHMQDKFARVMAYFRSAEWQNSNLSPANVPGSTGPLQSGDRKSTRLNSSHQLISYAVFCLKKKKK